MIEGHSYDVPPIADAPSLLAVGPAAPPGTPVWGLGSAAFVMAAWIVSQVVVGIIAVAVVVAGVDSWAAASVLFLLLLGAYVPPMGVILVVLRRKGSDLVEGLGFRRFGWLKSIGYALLGVTVVRIAASLVTGLILGLFSQGKPPEALDVTTLFPPGILGAAAIVIAACVAAPLVEEMMFRGVLMDAVTRRWGVKTGVIVSSLAFAAAHMSLWLIPAYFLIGVWLAITKLRTGSLWGAVMTHAAYNLVSVIAMYALAAIGRS